MKQAILSSRKGQAIASKDENALAPNRMKIAGKTLWDSKTGYLEVFHSPTQFQKCNDAKSVGFVTFPKGSDYGQSWRTEFQAKVGKHYQLAEVSHTQFHDWDKEIEVQEFKH